MMRKFYTLLFLFVLVAAIKLEAQVLYSNITRVSRFNPGLGANGTPLIAFDDVNISNDAVGDADSIGFTNIKIGIRRLNGARANTVNVYLTGVDPTSFGLDSVPVIPPTLIGTFNLAAYSGANTTQILSIGDSINVFKSVNRDTSNLFNGLQTVFIGISLSDSNFLSGWVISSGSYPNLDAGWIYDVDDLVAPRTAFSFGGNPAATLHIEAFGRPVYAPLAFDVKALSVNTPENITCFSGPQTVTVDLQNLGQSPVAAGAASVTLKVGGANTYNRTIATSSSIPVNGTTTVTFNDVNLSNPGLSLDTAIVSFGADLRNTNDTAYSGNITSTTINTYPILDDIEGNELTITPWVETITGGQLWSLHFADTAYTNEFMVDSLYPYSGQSFLYFDAFSGANSTGFESRLFSNCIALGAPSGGCASSLSFFLSHDTTFFSDALDDSLYISVSTDGGNSWNRIAGFGRLSDEFGVPGWSQEIVDLSAYNGSTIEIGFEGVSQYGNIVGVDNIEIISNCVVPVTLGSFTVQKQNKANRLSWTTTQEINSMMFVVQQSRNGRDFVTLGEVAAAGSSNTERTYSFTHNLPLSGYNYYRIKMVDRDNKVKYSQVRSVQNLGVNQIQVTPNPVADNMKVSINAEKSDVATIVIADISGKVIVNKNYNVTAGDNDIPVNTAALQAGSYIVKVQLNGDVQVSKFIKL